MRREEGRISWSRPDVRNLGTTTLVEASPSVEVGRRIYIHYIFSIQICAIESLSMKRSAYEYSVLSVASMAGYVLTR